PARGIRPRFPGNGSISRFQGFVGVLLFYPLVHGSRLLRVARERRSPCIAQGYSQGVKVKSVLYAGSSGGGAVHVVRPGGRASAVLRSHRDEIAAQITAQYFEQRPHLEQRWRGARAKCTEDSRLHLDCLCEALAFEHAALFLEYVQWAGTLLASL